MTSKYTLTLSDGITQFDIYEMEQNGPGNSSTPRLIQNVDLTGGAGTNFFELAGDLSYRFVAGFTFTVNNSGFGSPNNDGLYTVAPAGSVYSDPAGSPIGTGRTIIPVVETITTTGLPYGDITYSIPTSENVSSLLLNGKGTINYGSSIVENLVHLLENFASDVAPQYPLLGQLWYDTATSTIKKWNGSEFTADVNLDTYNLVFKDPENPNGTGSPASTDVTITGSDSVSPGPGIAIRTIIDPNSGDSILRVLSSTAQESLRVEFDGHVSTVGAFKQTHTTRDNEFSSDILFVDTTGIKSVGGAGIRTNVDGTVWDISGSVNFDSSTMYVDATSNLVGIGGLPGLGSPASTAKLQVFGNVDIHGSLNMQTHLVSNVVDPVGSQDAATKNYVDSTTVATTGDTMTGFLTLNADPTTALHAATKNYVDSTKNQLVTKDPVRAATVTTLTGYTPSGAGIGKLLTSSMGEHFQPDGISTVVGDRILIKDEVGVNAVHNGIYTVTVPGVDALQEITQITVVADNIGSPPVSLEGKYFILSAPESDYYVWYTTGGSPTTDPLVPGRIGIPVVYTASDTATTIATLTQTAIDNVLVGSPSASVFSASVIGSPAITVEVTNISAGTVTDATDAVGSPNLSTSFTIIVNQQGTDGTPYVITRATDNDEDVEVVSGTVVVVEEGSVNSSSAWILSSSNPVTVDTSTLTFDRFGGRAMLPYYDLQIGTGSIGSPPTPVVYTTPFNFSIAPSGKATIQVFVNGIKQVEGALKAYTTTPPNIITFNASSNPAIGSDVEFYGFG